MISDNDARVIIGLLRRSMASTEQVIDSIVSTQANTAALTVLLADQQTLLNAIIAGQSTNDAILEELKKSNEMLTILQGQL